MFARYRQFATVCCTAVCMASSAASPATSAEPGPGDARLGINLSGPKDWNTELPFVDAFRFSRPWISNQQGQPWGKGPPLDLDEHGWVKSLQPGCRATTLVCTIRDGHYPGGQYTILYDGRGRLDVPGARIGRQRPGAVEVDVDSSRGLRLEILQTDPADYVRNIRVIMPGFQNTYEKDPWNPAFLDRWRGFACLRFMDFMKTNGSEIRTWDDRPKPEDANWTTRGVPLEMMCDLANRIGCDPWFCMPHAANDDYVRQFARQARELLDPERHVYIEYSNEVWNGMFDSNKYAKQQGQQLGLSTRPDQAGHFYTAYRSMQIFRIWEEEFGGRERLVRVLASQAAVPNVSQQILSFRDAYRSADALAIAPYISWTVRKDEADGVIKLGVDGILNDVESVRLPKAIERMQAQKAVARQAGLRLIAYEAGQHLVGIFGAENNEQLTELFHQANRHPRMGDVYRRYYDAWEASGGGLMCLFNSVEEWSKWGSWGLLEYADERPEESPKFLTTLQWAAEHGQPVQLSGAAGTRRTPSRPRRRRGR